MDSHKWNRSRAGVWYIFRLIRPTKRNRAGRKHVPDPLASGEMLTGGVWSIFRPANSTAQIRAGRKHRPDPLESGNILQRAVNGGHDGDPPAAALFVVHAPCTRNSAHDA